jgi:hypothetical protein
MDTNGSGNDSTGERSAITAIWIVMAAALALVGMLATCGGCAHQETYIVDQATGEKIITGGMDSYGVFKNIAETRKYDPVTGNLIEVTTQSTSTTAEIMLGANELIGTAAGIAEKVKP